MPRPVITPLKGLDVIADKNPLSLSPAAFCNPELIKFIPYRNIPNAPNNVNTCNMLMIYVKIVWQINAKKNIKKT